ncbi:MAG: hypothetical protein ACK4J0_01250 [Candidatus Anstonellaceae archaeon]
MGGQTKDKQIISILTVLESIKNLESKFELFEKRLDTLEKKLSFSEENIQNQDYIKAKAGDLRQAQKGLNGVWVSHSNAPTSFVVQSQIMLSPIDEEILQIIRQRGAVCAQDIQKELSYKGQNAASARLARLASLNILKKHQAGRRVYYSFE